MQLLPCWRRDALGPLELSYNSIVEHNSAYFLLVIEECRQSLCLDSNIIETESHLNEDTTARFVTLTAFDHHLTHYFKHSKGDYDYYETKSGHSCQVNRNENTILKIIGSNRCILKLRML